MFCSSFVIHQYKPTHLVILTFFLLFLLLITLVPRISQLDAHWASDEILWLRRSSDFMKALSEREFSATAGTYHPGVITMWLAGLRMFLKDEGENPSLAELKSARKLMCFPISICVVVAFCLLHRLFGTGCAIICVLFLAFDPFFLAQSRRVHTDAISSILILLTVLCWLIYRFSPRRRCRYLIFSGITFGLAVLSKSYALILLMWVPMVIGRGVLKKPTILVVAMVEILCWGSCALLTVITLWPVFWTRDFFLLGLCVLSIIVFSFYSLRDEENKKPSGVFLTAIGFFAILGYTVKTVWTVFEGVGWAVTTPHEIEHFFWGRVTNDPRGFFYPLMLSIKSPPFILPTVLIGMVFLWKKRRESQYTQQYQIAFALFLVVAHLTVCLSVTSKKLDRYLLPAFLILDVLAGNLMWLMASKFWANFCRFNWMRGGTVMAGFLVFFIHTVPVFALHPYYGTYYNTCWKVFDITKIITVGDASGIDLAAKYLNEKPNASQLVVKVSPLAREFFGYYFRGQVFFDQLFPLDPDSVPDYEVVYLRDSQVGRVPQHGTYNGILECVITLNGIDYVWIYRV